jgi:hypothetical protein
MNNNSTFCPTPHDCSDIDYCVDQMCKMQKWPTGGKGGESAVPPPRPQSRWPMSSSNKKSEYSKHAPFLGRRYKWKKNNLREQHSPLQDSQLRRSCNDIKNHRSDIISTAEGLQCTHEKANEIYNKLETCICNPNNNSELSGGAIAGIVVGSVVGLALIIFLIYKFKRK